ncbi:MAG TPA: hypothetical protein VJ464_15880 [Blastocatellia bacterium]|nr:hypothetical protein [Blastocatellia bacterium]
MGDAEIQEEFDRRVKAIIENILRQERQLIEESRGLLDQARSDIVARMAEGGHTEWDAYWLRQVRAAVERRLEHLKRDLETSLNQGINRAFDLGNELVSDPVRAALGVNQPIGISREIVQVATQFSASLITDVTTSAQAAIDGVLQRAALGSVTVQTSIAEIGRSLDDPKIFRSIAARAETIFRTEFLRMQSIATQARMRSDAEAMRRAGWALGKRWLPPPLTKRSRLSHFAAMGQERALDDPFEVGGEELMFPRDPAGSAGNTINCRCVSQPTMKRIFKLDRDRKFER